MGKCESQTWDNAWQRMIARYRNCKVYNLEIDEGQDGGQGRCKTISGINSRKSRGENWKNLHFLIVGSLMF